MASASDRAKICVVCGTDCSNKPRTKDPRGRYYCRECYDHAKVGRGSASADAVKSRPKPMPVPNPAEVDAGEFNILDELVEAPLVAAASSARACANCGAALEPQAMICTGCGYNLQTGQQLQVTTSKARDKSGSSVPASVGMLFSPTIVGLACIVFFGAFFALARGNEQAAMAYLGVQFIFGLGATILVIIAGFRESILYGIGCFLCFPVALYVAFGINENAYVKWLYGTALLSSVLGYFLIDSIPNQYFGLKFE